MKIKTFLISSLIFLSLLYFPATSFADFQRSPWTQEDLYMNKISGKLGFGFMNFTTGWMAILFELAKSPFPKSLLTGPMYAITNTAGGAIHMLTFFIPIDVPLPMGGIAGEYGK